MVVFQGYCLQLRNLQSFLKATYNTLRLILNFDTISIYNYVTGNYNFNIRFFLRRVFLGFWKLREAEDKETEAFTLIKYYFCYVNVMAGLFVVEAKSSIY